MFGPKFQVEFCRAVKRVMVACTAFPQVDGKNARQLHEFIERRQSVESPLGEGESRFDREIREYTNILASKQNLKTVFAFVIITLLSAVKYSCHVIVLWLELDFRDFEQNVKVLQLETGNRTSLLMVGAGGDQRRPERIIKILCLLTNCTRLSSSDGRREEDLAGPLSNLADDLEYLPMFGLCHPTLRRFYEPAADLGSLTILMDHYFSLFVVCTCVIFPIQQILINRANDESLLYIVAPSITIELLCDQLQQIHASYLGSLENFRRLASATNQVQLAHSTTCAAHCRRIHLTLSPADIEDLRFRNNARFRSHPDEGHQKAPQKPRGATRAKTTRMDDERSFIRDCLPAIRTLWWRERIAKLYLVSFVFNTLCIVVPIAVLLLSIVIYKILTLKARLAAYDEFMAQEQCAIWHQGTVEPRVTVELAEYSFGWSLWNVIATATPITCAAYLIVILAAQIVVVINELACWLKEQRHDLLMLMELLRVRPLVLQERALSTQLNQQHHDERLGGLAILRDLFVQHTRIRFGFVYSAPLGSLEGHRSGPEVRVIHEELARRMLARCRNDDHEFAASTRHFLVELTEKVYVNHQLFIKICDLYSTKVAALILMQNLGLYGNIVVSALLAQTSPDVLWLSYLLNAFFISIILLFISIVSNFHAESRALQPLFWSLIARLQNYESDDVELRHLRQLFTKQTLHLGRIGGLAISAFGFRVTYTNVIQIVAWSSTIVALYLKDH